MTVRPVFLGYDPAEDRAYQVARHSLLRHASVPVHLQALRRPALEQSGLFGRPFDQIGKQRIDRRDGRPFSTDFTFTRFLVPALCQYDGWALFTDGDVLFTADVEALFRLADDRFAVMCVKHEHEPPEGAEKMGGLAQTRYRRKNWSSVVLWNCAHPRNAHLTAACVNSAPGAYLHAFDWLTDDLIGDLPAEWNWLEGHSASLGRMPALIHFTEGGPWIAGFREVEYGPLWRYEDRLARLETVDLPDAGVTAEVGRTADRLHRLFAASYPPRRHVLTSEWGDA